MASSAAEVYLHIGLPKTGTSYLQDRLWKSRDQLSASGVLVPGAKRSAQNLAAWDLMGRRPRGADRPQVPGSWDALVKEVRDWSGSHAVISEEFLAFARAGQVRRAVQAFAPAQVHVVVTLRDLARVLVAAWQQQLAKGQHWTWEEYAAVVRDPESGPASAGVAFWLRQDAVRVLDTWQVAVPPERIHLVTVPQPGAPRELLLQRFAAATRLDPAWMAVESPGRGNVSVGTAEAEVLRRLNLALDDRLNERQYTRVVAYGVRPVLQDRSSSPGMRLPEEQSAWVTARATAMVTALRRRGHHVVGDLDDLLPVADEAAGRRPDEVDPAELADAAVAALAAAVEQHAKLWWRFRDRDHSAAADGSRLTSSARAAAGRARLSALRLADRSRLTRRLAIRYLNRSP